MSNIIIKSITLKLFRDGRLTNCWTHWFPALPDRIQSGEPSVGLVVFLTAYTLSVPMVVPYMWYQNDMHWPSCWLSDGVHRRATSPGLRAPDASMYT